MSGQIIKISVDDEINTLIEAGLEPFDFKLYFLIRKRMDKETGITGKNFNFTRNNLIDEMQTSRPRGSTKPPLKITLQMIRESIKRLEKAGMVIIKSINTPNDKRLILKLPKALRDQSVQMRNNRGTTEGLQPMQNIESTESITTGTTDEQPTMNTRYQYINNIDNDDDNNAREEKNSLNKNSSISIPFTKWREFFSNLGFSLRHVCSKKSGILYKKWEEMGVTPDDMRYAIELCKLKGAENIVSPCYYENIVNDVMREKKELNNPKKSRFNSVVGFPKPAKIQPTQREIQIKKLRDKVEAAYSYCRQMKEFGLKEYGREKIIQQIKIDESELKRLESEE